MSKRRTAARLKYQVHFQCAAVDILIAYQHSNQELQLAQPAPAASAAPAIERKKRTIQEIRYSKTTGEKMVYMSVPDYKIGRAHV